jgi:CMP-N,N'-diacetyllegionaminic acid synthase
MILNLSTEMADEKVIAIIPARSGSKGLKDKNICPLAGKPLMAYTILTARESGVFDEIFVSTDSPCYADIAREYGASVPFLREYSLATDTTSSWDVVTNALLQYRDMGCKFNVAVLLQPTSPLRAVSDIQEAFKMYRAKNANAVVSVCEVDHPPLWCNTLPDDLSLTKFIKKSVKNKPRQLLEKYYRINGALYIVDVDYLMRSMDIYRNNCFAYIMPKLRSIDIDEEVDLLLAEMLLNNNTPPPPPPHKIFIFIWGYYPLYQV